MKQGYVLRVNVYLTSSAGGASLSVVSECLSNNECR
jgi:hypothetical protein